MSVKLVITITITISQLLATNLVSSQCQNFPEILNENWSKFEDDFANSIEIAAFLDRKVCKPATNLASPLSVSQPKSTAENAPAHLLLEKVMILYQLNQKSLKEEITDNDKNQFINIINDFSSLFRYKQHVLFSSSVVSSSRSLEIPYNENNSQLLRFIYSMSVKFGLTNAVIELWNRSDGKANEISNLIPIVSNELKFPGPLLEHAAQQLVDWYSLAKNGRLTEVDNLNVQRLVCHMRDLYNSSNVETNRRSRLVQYLRYIADKGLQGAIYRCAYYIKYNYDPYSAEALPKECYNQYGITSQNEVRQLIINWQKLLFEPKSQLNNDEHDYFVYFCHSLLPYRNDDDFKSKWGDNLKKLAKKDINHGMATLFSRLENRATIDGIKLELVVKIIDDLSTQYFYDKKVLKERYLSLTTILDPPESDQPTSPLYYSKKIHEAYEEYDKVIYEPNSRKKTALGRYLERFTRNDFRSKFQLFYAFVRDAYKAGRFDVIVQVYRNSQYFPVKLLQDSYRFLTDLKMSSSKPGYAPSFDEFKDFRNLAESIDWDDGPFNNVFRYIASAQQLSLIEQCKKEERSWNHKVLVAEVLDDVQGVFPSKNPAFVMDGKDLSENNDRWIAKLLPVCVALGSEQSCYRKATIACDKQFFTHILSIHETWLSSDICTMAHIYNTCITAILGSEEERDQLKETLTS